MFFENPIAFWLFLIYFVFIFAFVFSIYKLSLIQKSKSFRLLAISGKVPILFTRILYNFIFMFAIALVICAIANPCIKIEDIKFKYKDIRIFLLVDVSGSMLYAEDIEPNRLEAVKKDLYNFCNFLNGRYEVSIIPFAGTPNIYYCPLTYNRNILTSLVNEINENVAPAKGTNITEAVVAAKDQIVSKELNKSGINLVVILSDGGKEEADTNNRPLLYKTINELKNTVFYTVGVGGDKPTPLILRDKKGSFISYVTDIGKVSYSLLDEQILKDIAIKGKGEYIRFSEDGVLQNFLIDIIKENSLLIEEKPEYIFFSVANYFFGSSALIIILLYFYFLKRK